MKFSEGEIIDLDIKSLAYGGMGISYYNDMVVFVRGGIPGEKLKAKISKRKKNYLEAYALEKIRKSKKSVDPPCEHFGICGGCLFQNLDYKEQLNQKYIQVKDLFTRIGGIQTLPINKIVGCKNQYNYRNKMEFSYSSNRWIQNLGEKTPLDNLNAFGLHVRGRYDKIADINECHINGDLSNKIFKSLKNILSNQKIEPFNAKNKTGFLRNIIIREGHSTRQILINLITTSSNTKILSPIVKILTDEFLEIKSIINTIVKPNSGSLMSEKEEIIWGEDYISENIGQYLYKISSNSFFQTNSIQAKVLYDLIIKICEFKGDEVVYDLYCGTGSIGIYAAKYVKMVYGVEIVMSSVIDAIENAKNNNIKNIQFFHGDLINTFQNNQELKLIENPDIIILDPPRAGIHSNTLIDIIKFNAKKIIYVSCNPSTQARDVNILIKNGYSIKNIQPVDMFPHTPHIENIALLTNHE